MYVSNHIKPFVQELGPDRWSVKSISGQISDGYVVVKKFPTCSQCSSEGAHCSAKECVFFCAYTCMNVTPDALTTLMVIYVNTFIECIRSFVRGNMKMLLLTRISLMTHFISQCTQVKQ